MKFLNKRIISLLLALVMLCGMMPMQAFATEGTQETEAITELVEIADVTEKTDENNEEDTAIINGFIDDFSSDLSQTRTIGPWRHGYTWYANAPTGDIAVVDSKLKVTRSSGTAMVYIKALDISGSVDYAPQLTDFTLETTFTRYAPEGASEDIDSVTPRIFLRLNKTSAGYTGYYLTITGKNNGTRGTLSLKKMLPNANSTTYSELIKPYASVPIELGTEHTIKVEVVGDTFNIYYDGELKATVVDEGTGNGSPYMSGSVGVGAASQNGTVIYDDFKLALHKELPSAKSTNEFTDEFINELSLIRDVSPWEQGYSWGINATAGDITIADGKLSATYRAGSKNYTLAYITAPDAHGNDAAFAMEDYEFEVDFSRFAPEGTTTGNAVCPRIFFRLQNTPKGYTGYYLTITGTNDRAGGTISLRKLTPTGESSTTLMTPYWGVNCVMGKSHKIKVVAEGNVFQIYFDGELQETFVDENVGGVAPYLTGTVAVGSSTADGTVKYEYAKLSVIAKNEEEKKFKKYSFYGEISDFVDLWDMDADLDIVDRLLVNTGDTPAMATLKNSQRMSDYAVKASVTLPEQGEISLLGRYIATSNSFYELSLSKTDGLVMSKTVSGMKTILQTVTPQELYAKGLTVLGGGSYDLTLQMHGKNIEAYINGQIYALCEDDSIFTGVGGMILDPGATVVYLEIDEVNAVVSLAIMEDTNRNGIDQNLAENLAPFNSTLEVPVGKKPEIKHLYLKAEFFNGDVKYIPVDATITSGFDVSTLGEKVVAISYLNKDTELRYKVVDRFATIAELVSKITSLDIATLTIEDKTTVYALEDLYNDLTPEEKETVVDTVKEKLAQASEIIELLVYPELVGTNIVFEEHFDTADALSQYNSDIAVTSDTSVGYWYVENGSLLNYSTDDSVRTASMRSSLRLNNRNFEITSISVDVQIIDRNVWAGLDFHANGSERYRFYFCDKISVRNTETKKYGNYIDFYKGSTLVTRGWKYEDFWQPGEWINLRVTYVDGIIRCYVDDVLWIEYADSVNPFTSGSFGVVSAEGWAIFDNLVVRGIELDLDGTDNKYNTNLEPGEYIDDFEDETAGHSPSHWIENNCEDNWKVKLDGTNLVYGNENSISDDFSHSWLHVFDQDVDYSVKVKVTEAGNFPLVGLTARYNYDESYIKAGYDFAKQQWFIKVRYGWDFEESAVYSTASMLQMEVGKWYDLHLSVVDKKLALYVGTSTTPVVTADAGKKVMPGRVGIYTERCNVVIDNVELTMISGQSHVQDGVIEYTIDQTVAGSQLKYPSMIVLPDGRYLLVQDGMRMVSNDKGQSFEPTSEFDTTSIGESHVVLHDGTYLAVSSKNVYRSTDGCKTWTKLNDLPLDSRYSYAHTGDRLCEIQLDEGTYRIFVTIDARYNSEVYGVERTVISEIYYSDDGGETWTQSTNNAAQITNLVRFAESNIIKAADGNLVQYCSYNPGDCIRYNISYDNGVTWEGDYALPELVGGVVSFCVKEDPYALGVYYMSTVYNFPNKYNDGYPRHRVSLFKSTDGYNWDFLCDVDRWGDVSDGSRKNIMQDVNMYLTITEDYVFPMFARSERYSSAAHNIHFGRVYRFEKSKLTVQEFPQEYIIDGKHITYIEGIEEKVLLNSEYTANKTFVVHYYDGTSDAIPLDKALITGIDTSRLGKQTVTIDYQTFRAVCQIEVVNNVVTGHSEETVAGKAATCTATGLTDGKKCSVCGEVIVKQEVIPAIGHSEETVAGKAATCTVAGLTDGKKCSVCGEITVKQETIPANGHSEVTVAGKSATCTETGLTDGKKCSVCGATTVKQETIPAKGHSEVTVAGKVATCTATGLTDGKKCSVCGEVIVEQEVIPALGHVFENALCAICGIKDLTVQQGDINFDGIIDSSDVNLLYRAVMGYAELTNSLFADVNNDGKVDSSDVNLLYRFVMGYVQILTV